MVGRMLTVCTWLWGRKYDWVYVKKLAAGVRRHLHVDYRFVCITDLTCEHIKLNPEFSGIPIHEMWPIPDKDLLSVDDGCYARLRMFDPGWRAERNIQTLVCLDLDAVIVGNITSLFARHDKFKILHGGHFNPCPFNGSVMMLVPGMSGFIWNDFTVEEAQRVARADGEYRGTDQTWIAHKAPFADGWTWQDGIYAFQKPGWPKDSLDLPPPARIVVFPGKNDPSKLGHLPWIQRHWTR